MRALLFKETVSSLSPQAGEGGLNSERQLFQLIEQPKSAQLAPSIM